MKLLCKVYRSSRQEGMYLYVASDEGMERVPDSLMQRFGAPVEAMTLVLTEERTLARADTAQVMRQIEENGFYLQIPPLPGSEMQGLADRNDKLPR